MTEDQLSLINSADNFASKKDFIIEIAHINLGYLGISVAIILGTLVFVTVLFYFLNIKPVLKRLSEQETSLLDIQEKVKEDQEINETRNTKLADKIDEMISAERESIQERLSELISSHEQKFKELTETSLRQEKELSSALKKYRDETDDLTKNLRNKINLMEVVGTWNEHYLWMAHDIPENVFRSLVSCLEKSLRHKIKDLVHLPLNKIKEFLAKDENLNRVSNINETKDLLKLLDQVTDKDHQELVSTIRQRIEVT